MGKKWIAVNLALAALAGLLAWRLSVSVTRFTVENDISKLQPQRDIKQQISIEVGLTPFKPRRNANPEEFGIIPAQNVFAESRSIQKEVETPVEVAPKLTVRPVLVGVTLSGNQRLASVIEPGPQMQANPQASRRAQTKRVGDVIQGYTIVDITESQMVLKYGNQPEIIPLWDSTKPKGQGGKTPIVATRVVNIGPGGSGGAAGARPVVTQAGAVTTVVAPVGTASVTPASGANTDRIAQPGAVAASQQSGSRQIVTPARPTPGLSQQQPQAPGAWNERTDEQGRRIIRTPFGDIIRDKPPDNIRIVP